MGVLSIGYSVEHIREAFKNDKEELKGVQQPPKLLVTPKMLDDNRSKGLMDKDGVKIKNNKVGRKKHKKISELEKQISVLQQNNDNQLATIEHHRIIINRLQKQIEGGFERIPEVRANKTKTVIVDLDDESSKFDNAMKGILK